MEPKESVFAAWAPPESAWSAWAKPVLFAHLPRRLPEVALAFEEDLSWLPVPERRCALVIELGGLESVAMGLTIAERGYRPVPLFNACPPPERDELFLATEQKPIVAAVDVDAILAGMVQGAERLQTLRLSPDAPPAFLLNAFRKTPQQPLRPGQFDNRSVVFTTDVPSAGTLLSRGILEAIVIARGEVIQDDLQHVLRIWSQDGLSLALKRFDRAGPPEPLHMPAPSFLRGLWILFAAWLGLRRNPQGGFGAFVPEAAAS